MITLEIFDVPPTINKVLRMHWTTRKKLRDMWRKWVWATLRSQGYGDRLYGYPRARVSIERRSARLLDPDNLVASQKCVIDSLRYNHIIEDDTAQHIELCVTQCKGEARTLVKVEPL